MPEISTEKKEEQPVEIIDNSKKIKTLIYVGIALLAFLLLIILIALLFYYFYPSSSPPAPEITPITTSSSSLSSTPQTPITTSTTSSLLSPSLLSSSKPNSFSSSIVTSIPELTYIQRPVNNPIINKQPIAQPKIADNSYNNKILTRNKYMESLFKNGGGIKRFKRFCK